MAEGTATPGPARFRVADLIVDVGTQTIQRKPDSLELPDLSFRLLAALVLRAPDAVSKDELIQEVWGDVVVSDETLTQRVRLLRQALGEDSQKPRYIASVRGRGYRMICPVAAIDPDREGRWLGGIWAKLVAAAVLVFAATWFFAADLAENDTATTRNSVAVLPFADLSPRRDHGYFAAGIQEELLTRLTRIGNLDVASRTSVDNYRPNDQSLPEIGAELGVSSIIEGSVRIADDRVRITVQLIDAETDRHLWADNFDRELTPQNVISIQEQVANQIAQALELEYNADTPVQQAQLPTSSLAAYNAYLVGRHHTFQQTRADLEQAISYLQQATRLDPEFAEAYATLGWAYSFLGTAYGGQPPQDVYPEAREAAMKALSLDGGLADARSLYADILTWYDWDFASAEREYEKTLELDPLNVLGYALFLSIHQRHEEAIAVIERIIAAMPDGTYVRTNAAWRYLDADLYERAIAEAKLGEDHPDAQSVLGLAYLGAGETEMGIQILNQDLLEQGRNPKQLSNLAYAYFHAGRVAEGQGLLAELLAKAEQGYVSPTLLADVYFAAGDADSAFAMLEKGIRERDRGIVFLQVSQGLDGYREEPRYHALLNEIGFSL